MKGYTQRPPFVARLDSPGGTWAGTQETHLRTERIMTWGIIDLHNISAKTDNNRSKNYSNPTICSFILVSNNNKPD